jgi:hypothetical protein
MTIPRISVTNVGDNDFTIHQGFAIIAHITPAWLRYSAPALVNDTAELHRLITTAFTKAYAERDAAKISQEEKNALNSLALETFRKSARHKAKPHAVSLAIIGAEQTDAIAA